MYGLHGRGELEWQVKVLNPIEMLEYTHLFQPGFRMLAYFLGKKLNLKSNVF